MKKQILTPLMTAAVLISNPAFAMLREGDVIENKSTPIPNSFQYSKEGYTLRSPKTGKEWGTYHDIRIAEIHNRYCPELIYDDEDPEEVKEGNFRFVFLSPESAVLGTIRVDLLEQDNEASLRWVAMRSESQRQGFGRRMLELTEWFIKDKSRSLVRVPAEEESRGFYEKLGYTYMDWPEGPKNSGNIPLVKELTLPLL